MHFLKTVLTAIVAHVTNIGALTHYLQVVYNLSQTFTELSLGLNTTQSKELCCGCRDSASPLFQPLSIQPVKQVQSLRYLDKEIDTPPVLLTAQRQNIQEKHNNVSSSPAQKPQNFSGQQGCSNLEINISSWYKQTRTQTQKKTH